MTHTVREPTRASFLRWLSRLLALAVLAGVAAMAGGCREPQSVYYLEYQGTGQTTGAFITALAVAQGVTPPLLDIREQRVDMTKEKLHRLGLKFDQGLVVDVTMQAADFAGPRELGTIFLRIRNAQGREVAGQFFSAFGPPAKLQHTVR